MSNIEIRSPFDGHLIKTITLQSEAQAELALAKAYALFNDRNRWLSKAQRIDILKKAHQIVQSRLEALARTAAEEGGKPLVDSRIEVSRAARGIELAAEHLASMGGEEIPMGTTTSSEHRFAYTFHEPRGVVLAISAFNHPLNLIVHQVIPALAVGCPVIAKPSGKTPLSCLGLAKIFLEAGLSEHWWHTLILDNDSTLKLVGDSRVSFLSFIGSSRVGWMLRSKLAPGALCTLEHGGAAPVIVAPDADLNDAVPLLVKGGFYHAGQVCVSVQRIYAHSSIIDELAKRLVEGANKLIVGDPLDPSTEVGPLIAHREVDRVDEWVQEAVAQGAQLLCGGKKISNSCYQPTILLNASEQARVSTHEIFGPVVCIYSYEKFEEAIERANKPFFCFQAAIFTKNIDTALTAARRLEATTVLVNDHTAFRIDSMPFGGRKDSGVGMGGIAYSMEEMAAKKMIVIRSQTL